MSHSTNENSKSKVPKIKENAWLFYELRMSTYLGKDVMRCLNEPRPRAMDNLSAQDLEAFNATIPANGRETAATRAWRAARTASINFWDDANVKINRALVESCEDNSTAELICLEADEQENSSAATIWAALQKRFNNKNAVTTTREVGIFNTMYVASGETRGEWIDRLTKQILKIEGRGRRIFEGDRVERLLDGMTANPLYKTEAATLQLLTDNTWDSVTSMLISYDDRDQGNKPGDQANAAITESTIICHGCGEAGHKRICAENAATTPATAIMQRHFANISRTRTKNARARNRKTRTTIVTLSHLAWFKNTPTPPLIWPLLACWILDAARTLWMHALCPMTSRWIALRAVTSRPRVPARLCRLWAVRMLVC